MNWFHAILLGIVEGITEFLPVSSTGHLNIIEHLLGYRIDDPGMTAFTAIIQVGAIIAAIVYFRTDIVRIAVAWYRGLRSADARRDPDYRLGWGVIIGSVPVAVVGLLFKGAIETTLRSMWVVAGALLLWSIVMWIADRLPHHDRGMHDVTLKDSLVIGLFQALAPLFPGISRSGATISAGLFRGFDRVTATRLSFYMGIPALIAAGGLEAATQAGAVSASVGWGPTVLATVVSFVVAYVSIAWLLKFVSTNDFTGFIVYRILLGLLLLGLLMTELIPA